MVVEEIARHLHKSIQVAYVPVTPANRFELVDSGAVDLECGSTTASAERRLRFGFSPTIFVRARKMRQAVQLVRARDPQLAVEGEMRGDAALERDQLQRAAPPDAASSRRG